MNACLSVRGVTVLAIPARRAALRTIRPAPCRPGRRPPAAGNAGPAARSPMARPITPCRARCERDGDDLAALAGNRQGPVAAFEAGVLDFRSVPRLPFGHGGEALPNVLRFGLDPEASPWT
jgi:hypothetical protein